MSMSTHVTGIRPPDEKFKKMLAVWQACEAAGIEVPDEVDDFFNGEKPDPKGVQVDLTPPNGRANNWDGSVRVYAADGCQGFDIALQSLLDQGFVLVRVHNY
jgi:hypothetical protein